MNTIAHLSRRSLLMAVGGVGIGAVLTACDAATEETTKPIAALTVPTALPSTFAAEARWAAPAAVAATPVQLTEGVALLAPGTKDAAKYRVRLLDPSNGAPRWESAEFESPAEGAPEPQMSAVGSRSDSWVAITTHAGPNTITLDLYQAAGAGDRRTPERSVTLEGPDMATLPVLIIGERGAVVTGLAGGPADSAYVLDLGDGSPSPWQGPGVLVESWDEGQVATGVSERSGFGFVVGGAPIWESADVAPVVKGSAGTGGALLAVGAGVIVAQWVVGGHVVLAVHAVRTGVVLASLSVASDPDVAPDAAVLASPDGEWVSWGGYVFGVRGQSSRELNLLGSRPVCLYRDVLYVAGSSTPLTASRAAAASDGGGSSSGGGSGRFGGLLDVGTGQWLTNDPVESVPVFVSDASQGLFVVKDRQAQRVFSVPAR